MTSALNEFTRYAGHMLPPAGGPATLPTLAGCRLTLHRTKTDNRKRQLINNSSCVKLNNRDFDSGCASVDDGKVGAFGLIKGI